MAIAGSVTVIILGALVAFAVNAEVAGIDLRVVGYIIMIVGVVGLVFSLAARRRNTDQAPHRKHDGTTR